VSACPRVAISFIDENYYDMGVAFTRSHMRNVGCYWSSDVLHVPLQKMIEMSTIFGISNIWV
jgi:hypothetical protein